MSLVELNKINFDNTSIKVYPQRHYVSGSSYALNSIEGETGCVPAIGTRSKSIKEIDNVSSDILFSERFEDINRARAAGETGELVNHGYQYLFDTDIRLNASQSDNYKFKIKRNTLDYRDPESRFDKNGRPLSVRDKNSAFYKKNYIKSKLYKSKKDLSTLADHYNYGFCNYNSINFFTLQNHPDATIPGNLENKSHKTCIIYPNSGGTDYTPDTMKGDDASYTISFWINPRRSNVNGYDYNPGTILHIPGLIGIYLVKGTSLDEYGHVDKFRLLIETSDDSYTMPSSSLVLEASMTISDSGLSFITDDNILDKNKWYHVAFSYKNRLPKLYLDGVNLLGSQDDIELFDPPSIDTSFSKTIYIGNRLNYTQEAEWSDDVYNYFFGSDVAIDYDCTDNGVANGRALATVQPDFNDVLDLDTSTSTALNAELADLRIYKEARFEEQIKEDMKFYINDFRDIKHSDILFYVPVYFVSEVRTRKVDVVYGSKFRLDIDGPVNPYLSHRILGHEVSVEHFLNEFVKKTKPYITGIQSPDLSGTEIDAEMTTFESVHHKINKAYATGELIQNSRQDNHLYRNHLIMPNDNGRTYPRWGLVESVYEDAKNFVFSKDIYGNFVPGLVSLEEIIDANKITTTIPEDGVFTRPFLSNFAYGSLYRNNRKLGDNTQLERLLGILDSMDDRASEADALNILAPGNNIISRPCIYNTLSPVESKSAEDFGFNTTNRMLILHEVTSYIGDTYGPVFEIPNAFYGSKIKEETVELSDFDIAGTAGALQMTLKDNFHGGMYRADCLSPQAKWNYVGHVFRNEGFISLLHPSMASFGEFAFDIKFKGEQGLNVFEINVPCDAGELNVSQNAAYKKIKPTEYFADSTIDFVFIDTINLHDENLNIVAKANLSQPLSKRITDKYNFRLKLDY